MLKKISRGITHASAGKRGSKYKISILVEKLDNLPAAVKRCRVVWSRGPKVQMTDVRDVVKGSVAFKQQLSQIATMYQDANDDFEPKEYKFQVQVPSTEGDNKHMAVGKADLDLSIFVLNEGQAQNKLIPILFKVGSASTGYLKVVITLEAVAGLVDDDGMTEVSALTGMTTHMEDEQDLSGFEEPGEQEQFGSGSKPSSTAQNSAARRPASRLRASTPPPAATEEGNKQHKPPSSSITYAKAAPAAANVEEDDGDISPMTMSPEDSSVTSPRESSRTGTRDPGKQSTIPDKAAADSKADKVARAELFSTGPLRSSGGTKSSNPAHAVSSRDVQDLTDDEARSELFASGTDKQGKRTSMPQTSSIASRDRSKPQTVPIPLKSAITPAVPLESTSNSRATRSPSMLNDASAGSAGVSSAAASSAAARRTLLSRRQSASDQQPEVATPAIKEQPSSSQQGSRSAATAAASNSKHQLSDEDSELECACSTSLLKPLGSRNVPISRLPSTPSADMQHKQPPTSLSAAAGANSTGHNEGAGIKQCAAENERLQAQVAALRNQAVQAEEARRQAKLAAENAAAERDDYKAQVQELQQQLQEVICTTVSAEEAQEMVGRVQDLQEQLQHKIEELELATNAAAGLQLHCDSTQQQLMQSQRDMDELGQQLAASESHVKQLQQEHEAVQLEAVEQLKQLLQQPSAERVAETLGHGSDVLHIPRQSSATDVTANASATVSAVNEDTADLKARLVQQEQTLVNMQKQRDSMLAMLSSAAHMAAQEESVKQFIWDKELINAAGEAVAAAGLELQETWQEEVQQVLVCLKAATASAVHHSQCMARLQVKIHTSAPPVPADKRGGCDVQQVAVATVEAVNGNIVHQPQQLAQTDLTLLQRSRSGHQHQQQDRGTHLQHQSAGAVSEIALEPVTQQLAKSKQKVQHLIRTRNKLETVLQDFEASAAEERQQLLVQLSAANQQLRQVTQQLQHAERQLAEATEVQQQLDSQLQAAEVAVAAAQLAAAEATEEQHRLQAALVEAQAATATMADRRGSCPSSDQLSQVVALTDSASVDSDLQNALSAAQVQVVELQKQLAEHETSKKALDRELTRIRKQLADEQAERATVEEQLAQHLEDTGNYTAQDTVAAYEAKYNRLKTRFRELTASHRDEVSGFHEEIATLQDKVATLEAATVQLDAARSQAQHGEATLADALVKSSKASAELAVLQADNQQLMQSLVSAKLHLAQVSEREVISRRELYKAKETNMKLASKMTKLETMVYK